MSDPSEVAQSFLVHACAKRLLATHGPEGRAGAHAFASDRMQAAITAGEHAEALFWQQVADKLDPQAKPLWSRPASLGHPADRPTLRTSSEFQGKG